MVVPKKNGRGNRKIAWKNKEEIIRFLQTRDKYIDHNGFLKDVSIKDVEVISNTLNKFATELENLKNISLNFSNMNLPASTLNISQQIQNHNDNFQHG